MLCLIHCFIGSGASRRSFVLPAAIEIGRPFALREFVAEVDVQYRAQETCAIDVGQRIGPDPRLVRGRSDVHSNMGGIVLVPGRKTDDDPAVAAFADELDDRVIQLMSDLARGAPVAVLSAGQRQPRLVRGRGEEMGKGVDADRVVSALDEFVERDVPVLVTRAGPTALDPGKIPHRYGARPDCCERGSCQFLKSESMEEDLMSLVSRSCHAISLHMPRNCGPQKLEVARPTQRPCLAACSTPIAVMSLIHPRVQTLPNPYSQPSAQHSVVTSGLPVARDQAATLSISSRSLRS